jgi:bifunctional DNA-binding transcriptional regulator/antitoxin component of YhaV-PrlF toxin-antitoxin module
MNAKNVTITSKNQVTLPADYVRKMQLARNRVLKAELRGREIVLTPQPSLGATMQRFWGKHQVTRPLSDDELKQAVRTSSIERLSRDL